jgi:hypothetical protein
LSAIVEVPVSAAAKAGRRTLAKEADRPVNASVQVPKKEYVHATDG